MCKFLKTYTKMDKKLKLGETEIEKQKFHQHN